MAFPSFILLQQIIAYNYIFITIKQGHFLSFASNKTISFVKNKNLNEAKYCISLCRSFLVH